jgi:Escherichia/Staphylococcus phage prohead protease
MVTAYRTVPFELTELKARGDDGWSFSGYASTFGNIDEGGDVVLRGAFSQSIASRVPRLLWQHNMDEPIGRVVALTEDDRGLHGDFKLSRTTRGHDAYQLLKDGAIDSMSIGYIPEEQEFDDLHNVRKLKSVDLLEISLVSIPMNEEARITSVKTRVDPPSDPAEPTVASLHLRITRKRLERLQLLEHA